MELTPPDQLWVADLTHVRVQQEFVYLAVVLDAFSRRVVGWALNHSLRSTVAVDALQQAIDERNPRPGLVHHSDRGVPIRIRRLHQSPAQARCHLQHEPCWKSLRQRPMRKLPENAQTGKNLLP